LYRLPRQHHKHLKSTNLLERLNKEIKRRTPRRPDFPQRPKLSAADLGARGSRCTRTGSRRTATLREHKKEALRMAA
jgi:putative transposase